MRKYITAYYPGLLLFLLALVVALFIYRDYGMSWDEPAQRGTGRLTYNYVFDNNKDLLTYDDRRYGVFVELPLIILEKKLNLTDPRDIYQMRHLASHVLFLIGAFFFYVLVYRLFNNKLLAAIGFLMLLLSPRLYAHSYFNTKDLPFLSLIIISLTISQMAFSKNRTWLFCILGMAVGCATGTRIMGIMIAAFITGLLVIDIITGHLQRSGIRKAWSNLTVFIAAFCLTLYAVWPYLWPTPVNHFTEAYQTMAHFKWQGVVLFKGELIAAPELPWTYFPTWFFISNPIVWLLAGCVGIVLLIIRFCKKPLHYLQNTSERNFILYLACLLVPIVLVIGLHSIIYDDWRHLYFVYPPFLLLALYVAQNAGKIKNAVMALYVIQLGFTGFFMVRNHPYQHVYFNNFVSHDSEYLRKNYEMEYWGVSFIDALKYISKTDPSPHIKVASGFNLASEPLANNMSMLKPVDRQRFEKTPAEQADYYITNFREHVPTLPYTKVVLDKKVLNSTILRVYKLH